MDVKRRTARLSYGNPSESVENGMVCDQKTERPTTTCAFFLSKVRARVGAVRESTSVVNWERTTDVMYLKMYIKSERFYQQPDNQPLKEERCFSDYEEELDEREYLA
ncbi:unnamed protein product [Chilo suppressalis]|uniref:Uncharacterized protein n=1 Tax=Chilo suppressalis TaxID=168631 RepID=A0ABN8AY92_CHISP|nr:unnamed protein product [Chilo suppressalis]